MDNYEKPAVLANEDIAEGVYAASGAEDNCYEVTTKIHQKPETGRVDYRIQVDARHAAGDNHHSTAQELVLSFNQPVEYISSDGTLLEGDGSTSITIAYSYHSNEYDKIGLGDVVVKADAGLAVTGAALSCNHDCTHR